MRYIWMHRAAKITAEQPSAREREENQQNLILSLERWTILLVIKASFSISYLPKPNYNQKRQLRMNRIWATPVNGTRWENSPKVMNGIGIHQSLGNEQTQISNLNSCQKLLGKINTRHISKHPFWVSLLISPSSPSKPVSRLPPPSSSSFH